MVCSERALELGDYEFTVYGDMPVVLVCVTYPLKKRTDETTLN